MIFSYLATLGALALGDSRLGVNDTVVVSDASAVPNFCKMIFCMNFYWHEFPPSFWHIATLGHISGNISTGKSAISVEFPGASVFPNFCKCFSSAHM